VYYFARTIHFFSCLVSAQFGLNLGCLDLTQVHFQLLTHHLLTSFLYTLPNALQNILILVFLPHAKSVFTFATSKVFAAA